MKRMRALVRFNFQHLDDKLGVVGLAILSEVNSSMAGGAQRYHKTRVIGSTIAEAPYVMRFKVWIACARHEWSRLLASFATAIGSSTNIVSDDATSLDDAYVLLAHSRNVRRGCECRRPHICKPAIRFDRLLFKRGFNRFCRPEFKDNRLANVVLAIRRIFVVKAGIDHFTFKPISGRQFAKKQQVLSIPPVITDGEVPAHELHVADLAFAKIFKHAVRPLAIGIPVRQSLFASDDDHQSKFGRRYDSTLLLSAEASVDVDPPVVNATALKSPTHAILPLVAVIVTDCHCRVHPGGRLRLRTISEDRRGGVRTRDNEFKFFRKDECQQ